MPERKPKFAGMKTKREKRRIARDYAREAIRWEGDKKQKPLAKPLTIAPLEERMAALKKGKMVFYDGRERIELDLSRTERKLVGVYKIGNALLTVRVDPHGLMGICEVEKSGQGFLEKPAMQSGFRESYFCAMPDLGHMELQQPLRGHGLGKKAVSRAERHVRAQARGTHSFIAPEKFRPLFEKLGYVKVLTFQRFGKEVHLLEKSGKYREEDNFSTHYGFEAIDPKTGKARMFYFPIGKK